MIYELTFNASLMHSICSLYLHFLKEHNNRDDTFQENYEKEKLLSPTLNPEKKTFGNIYLRRKKV